MSDLREKAQALLDAMDNRSIPMSQLDQQIGIVEAIEKASVKRLRRIEECKAALRTALAAETVRVPKCQACWDSGKALVYNRGSGYSRLDHCPICNPLSARPEVKNG